MPANVVKPGEEKYWDEAKQEASDSYKESDDAYWPTVMNIFKNKVKKYKGREVGSMPMRQAHILYKEGKLEESFALWKQAKGAPAATSLESAVYKWLEKLSSTIAKKFNGKVIGEVSMNAHQYPAFKVDIEEHGADVEIKCQWDRKFENIVVYTMTTGDEGFKPTVFPVNTPIKKIVSGIDAALSEVVSP